ncbi:hypothetical protein PBY51_024899 [Eleginops maclovinus]|uniref:Uncharacterized protein n=1 Tax=Eleginops maclovinus TaxID=56733 RepID=A0AAN7Y0K6_ELEMC|nr:hypothetical protein PBY51_024899 [Eleginops maclovinus]
MEGGGGLCKHAEREASSVCGARHTPRGGFLTAEVSQGDRRSWSVYAGSHLPQPHATRFIQADSRAGPQDAEDLSVSLSASHVFTPHQKTLTGLASCEH